MDIKVIIAIVYIAIMITVGIINSKKIKTYSDFTIASRNIPFWRNIHSISASMIAGLCYSFGVSGNWIGIGSGMGLFAAGMIFAEKLWKSEAVTFPEIINKRFGTVVGNTSSALVVFAQIAITASQMLALGIVTQRLINVPFIWALIIAVGVIVVYTVLGGLFSTAMTDSVNMIIMVVSIMIILPFVEIIKSGGFGNIQLPQGHTDVFNMGFLPILGLVLWIFCASLMDQGTFLRMFGARSAKEAKRAAVVAAWGVYIPYLLSVMVIGLLAAVLLPGIEQSDAVIPLVITKLLGSFIGGIVLAGLLGAVLSTAGSMIIVTSNNITNDIIKRIKPDLANKTLVKIARINVVVVGIIAAVFALYANNIIQLMQDLSSPYISALFPVLIAALYSKSATSKAALATIIVGAGSAIIWWAVGQPFGIHHIIPSLVLASITMIITTIFTKGKISQTTI